MAITGREQAIASAQAAARAAGLENLRFAVWDLAEPWAERAFDLITAFDVIHDQARPDRVLLLPVLWLGASEHHLPFGGTLTATLPTYEQMLVELLAPLLRDGFRRVLLLNGHGGNIDPLHVALRRLDAEFPGAILTGAAYWELAEAEIAGLCEGPRKSVGHACEVETSMMMHLRPDLVRADRIADDPHPADPRGLFWARDFGRRTDHGAVGYPEKADAERGRRMLEAINDRVTAVADEILKLSLPGS